MKIDYQNVIRINEFSGMTRTGHIRALVQKQLYAIHPDAPPTVVNIMVKAVREALGLSRPAKVAPPITKTTVITDATVAADDNNKIVLDEPNICATPQCVEGVDGEDIFCPGCLEGKTNFQGHFQPEIENVDNGEKLDIKIPGVCAQPSCITSVETDQEYCSYCTSAMAKRAERSNKQPIEEGNLNDTQAIS